MNNRLIGAGLLIAVMTFASAAWAQKTPAPPASAGYILGSGDKVKVTVYDEEELSGEFTVSPTGTISLPLAGEMQASGVSVDKLQAEIKNALQPKYLKDANVTVELLNLRPFYILGEVDKPGQYPYAAGLTVLGAVATAGGFTYRANTHKVYIKHANESEENKYPLAASTAISAGDTIRIDERHF